MTSINYKDIPLRGLKILRKAARKVRRDVTQRMILRDLNDKIMKRQSAPRQVFHPLFINRQQHRRKMAIMSKDDK